MNTWRRRLTVLVLASYVLAVSASARFHNHHSDDDGDQRPGFAASHSGDSHDCSVCQFLAQKPAPTSDVAPVELSALVQQVAAVPLALCMCGIFTAWQSRAPPAFA